VYAVLNTLASPATIGVTPRCGFGKASCRLTACGMLMILSLFSRSRRPDAAGELYGRIATAALRPELYINGSIPDTFEGRFESVTLHVFIVIRRLKMLPAPGREASQELIDITFQRFDDSMRQLGISDVAIPKKMKKLAHGFYGRIEAYETALTANNEAQLSTALARNITDGNDASSLANYVIAATRRFDGLDLDAIFQADPLFPSFNEVSQ
jgi:cytochrome b pre-mRNA-processing protein 3